MQCSDLMNYIGCLEITRHDLFTYINHITIRLGAKTKPSSLASGLKQKPKWVPQQLSSDVMFQNPQISLRGKLEGRMFYDDKHQSISFPLVNAPYTSQLQERKKGATYVSNRMWRKNCSDSGRWLNISTFMRRLGITHDREWFNLLVLI